MASKRARFHTLEHSKCEKTYPSFIQRYFLSYVLTHIVVFLSSCSTCFNRIDLPNYTSKKHLREKLKAAVTLSAVGFGIE